MSEPEFINADHEEAVDFELSLGDALDAVIDLSNRLYKRNPSHPLIDELSSVQMAIEAVPWDTYYEAIEREVGEDAWWAES